MLEQCAILTGPPLTNQSVRVVDKPTPTETDALFTSRLVDLAHQYQRTPISQRCLLSKKHISKLKELRKNTEVIILPPDKGSGVVLLNRADYINKMHSILSHTSKFVIDEGRTDAVQNAERQINRALKNLHRKGLIDQTNLKKLSPKGSVTPRMYGLPKTQTWSAFTTNVIHDWLTIPPACPVARQPD
ncbi:uncharacterized protein DEA37_0001564 [Paragonimus westermani]|uniref:Uncharacterized protein n=1 Tax=Paragonimus westermani TaxID=34504 RepID=A0A5J4NSI9_9TREM|nr:uncharacterized protein DEA37_0001564 [Paragonimus westermani]